MKLGSLQTKRSVSLKEAVDHVHADAHAASDIGLCKREHLAVSSANVNNVVAGTQVGALDGKLADSQYMRGRVLQDGNKVAKAVIDIGGCGIRGHDK